MAEEILSKRKERTEKTIDAVNRRGKKIRCRVFAMPFQRDGDITGAVLLTEELPD